MSSQPIPPSHLIIDLLVEMRATRPPDQFRTMLRQTMVKRPDITLHQVAQALGITRQAVAQMVGRLGRPTCARPNRPAPKREQAALHLKELARRVAAGESSERAAEALGISLAAAIKLGFRAKVARPPHGTWERARTGCNCWPCRRVAGVALPRGKKADAQTRATVLDWLAYQDPDTGAALTQTEIGKLAGVGQGAVSRIARAAGPEN